MNSKYEVGFKKPPKSSQFKKGKSGNPKGRPKGTNNLKTDLKEEMNERISFRENGVEKRHSKQRLLLKGLIAKAMKGDVRATSFILNLNMKLIEGEESQISETPLNREEESLLDDLGKRLLDRHSQKGDENE